MRRSQRGVALVLMAMMLVTLCGAAALALDVGVLFAAKNGAQNAADAAALAGAYTFLNPVAAQPQAAQNAAVALADANEILGKAVQITSADVSVDSSNRLVTVTVPRTGDNGIQMFFARVFGADHADVIATATAQAMPQASGSSDLKPLFVPNTILSNDPPAKACSEGQTILDSQGTVTDYALSQVGNEVSLRPMPGSGGLRSGQFLSLDFGSGIGGVFGSMCTLGSNLPSCGISPPIAPCGGTYATGTLSGGQGGDPLGIVWLILFYLLGGRQQNQWIAPGAYQGSYGVVDSSPQVATAAVWNDCPNGSVASSEQVIGFSNWFIDDHLPFGQGGWGLPAHFLNAAGCGPDGSNGPTTPSNAPMGIPVRLVTPN